MTYLTSISCVSLLTVNHKLTLHTSLHGVIKAAWGSFLITVINGSSFPTCSPYLFLAPAPWSSCCSCPLEETVVNGRCTQNCCFAHLGLNPGVDFGNCPLTPGYDFANFKYGCEAVSFIVYSGHSEEHVLRVLPRTASPPPTIQDLSGDKLPSPRARF